MTAFNKAEPLASVTDSLRSGERDPVVYAETLCDRIDAQDPEIRAFLPEGNRRERLVEEATSVRDQHADSDKRPPLYGVPVGIKDVVRVNGFPTQAGSVLPPEVFAGPEATVVSALREAGAFILGKTVTTEFAGRAPGLTRNPCDTRHTPGGSSSGSAAAVAAGMTPLAIGTQTGGSVIRPAAFCGVVGFKPSFDRISTAGVVPRSPSLDHVGLFTADVEGMAHAASTICADWDEKAPDRRPRLGIPEGSYLEQASTAARKAFNEQVSQLSAAKYDVCRVDPFDDFDCLEKQYWNLTAAEQALVHEDWFSKYEHFYRVPSAERVQRGREVTSGELAASRRYAGELRSSVHDEMDSANVDLWLSPAAPGPAAAGITDTGNPILNIPWTYAGLPAVTVPAGSVRNLPVGLQCVGRFGADERLLSWTRDIAALLDTVQPN